MEDEDIIKFLQRHKKQLFSARELSEILNAREYRVCIRLKQLVKYALIKYKEIERDVARKIYGKDMKRKITLYYIEK